jgi:hypothetical protein
LLENPLSSMHTKFHLQQLVHNNETNLFRMFTFSKEGTLRTQYLSELISKEVQLTLQVHLLV